MFAFIIILAFSLITQSCTAMKLKLNFNSNDNRIGIYKCYTKDYSIQLMFKFFQKPSSHTISFCVHQSNLEGDCLSIESKNGSIKNMGKIR